VLLGALIGYDYMLKAEYQSGKYKDPYDGFTTLKFKDFDILDLYSSTVANVRFVQGPFSVRIDPSALKYIKLKQDGRHLLITANFENQYESNRNSYLLVISCPKLEEVNVNATYGTYQKTITDTIVREEWHMKEILIDGFKQDSLNISQDYGSTVVLANNAIKSVKAVIGKSKDSGSKIVIRKNNQFQDATFDIGNKSTLILEKADIHSLNYQLADSAKLILSGAARDFLKKQ
jgi:hypothetical protein